MTLSAPRSSFHGWLLDTNVIAEIGNRAGAKRVHDWAAAQDETLLHISILTIGEYKKGLHNLPAESARIPSIAAALAAFEARFAGRILPVSDAVVRRWGIISGTVKRVTRQSPPVVDTMLAATAIEHGLHLVTRNIADVRHSGAPTFNPWTD